MTIQPLEDAEVEHQGLDQTVASFRRMGDPTERFPRILGHAPAYASAMWDAMSEALFEGSVDPQLKELIRIQLATTAGDPYFSALRSEHAVGLSEARIQSARDGGFTEDDDFTAAEKWALRYAYLMYREPERVDAAFYEEGKRHYSEAEIMEIGGLVATHYGMAVFMSTLAGDTPS